MKQSSNFLMDLIIVESPTKARTLARFLGGEYRIEATMGHIRDLPEKKLGIEIQQSTIFIPEYQIITKKKKRITELRAHAKDASRIILATDPDREGEAIAWHVAEIIRHSERAKRTKNPVGHSKTGWDPSGGTGQYLPSSATPPQDDGGGIQRIVFHEITKSAIDEALSHPRVIDMHLVDAQQARRILDRLVGYKLSPLLWNKLGKRWLSAGRVQSVAVRLIVEREREIEAFKPEEYWNIEALLQKAQSAKLKAQSQSEKRKTESENEEADSFIARLTHVGDTKAEVKNKEQADGIIADLKIASYRVSNVTTKEVRRYPYPPFTTSTLQQAGSNRFGWSAKRTMQTAQSLYEEGFITYHRTDSTNVAVEAMTMVRAYIEETYGTSYLPESPKLYKTKSKVAQEAHEAIRPTQADKKTFEAVLTRIGREAQRLYILIFNRFVACQMREAVFDATSVDVEASRENNVILSGAKNPEGNLDAGRDPSSATPPQDDKVYLLRANGQHIKFDGWLRVYGEVKSEDEKEEQKDLPLLTEGEPLDLLKLLPQQKFTEPPPRYNEASLIKTLEEKAIGRPSTYAPIISTIQDRKYVEKVDRRFFPTNLGATVNDFLVSNFPDIFDISFTAKMEDGLDEVANGNIAWGDVIGEFYGPFAAKLDTVFKEAERVKVDLGSSDEICPTCGSQLVFRLSKFGKFLACSNFPECRFTKTIVEKAGIPCPKCGGDVIVKKTRRGKQFYGCFNYPTCNFAAWKKEDIK